MIYSLEEFEKFDNKFKDCLSNDVNTSTALTVVFDVLKSNVNDTTKIALLKSFDKVLGLDFEKAIDGNLEKALTNNKDWYDRVLKFRKVIKEICNDDVVIGQRAMLDGADLLDAGFSQSEVEDMVIYKGIDEDIVDSIKAKMGVQNEHTRNFIPQNNSNFKVIDGLVALSDDNNNIGVWFDEQFCKEDGYELASIVRNELGLH